MKRLIVFVLMGWLAASAFIPTLVQAGEFNWIKYSGNPVMTGADPTGAPTVLEIDGQYHMWYINQWDIWRAESNDGFNWTTSGTNPVFGDGRGLSLGTVRYTGSSFQMWYGWGGATGQTGYASSTDGATWTDYGLIMGPGPGSYDAYVAAIPFVMYDETADPNDRYKMWYSAQASLTGGYGIAYATSPNPEGPWTKQGLVFETEYGTWYSHAIGSPFVEKTEDGYVMWFGGSAGQGVPGSIGHVHSPDGIHWDHDTVQVDLTIGGEGEWDDTTVGAPWLLSLDDGSRLLYYAAASGPGNTTAIGLARSAGPVPAPAALLLLGSGLVGLAGFRRRLGKN